MYVVLGAIEGFPQVPGRFGRHSATLAVSQNSYTRTMRVGCMHLEHDGDLIGAQPDDRTGWIDTDKLHESPNEILIKLLPVIAFHDRQDTVAWEGLLIGAL